MEDHTLFDFTVGVSFFGGGDGIVWYQANVYAPDSFLPPPAQVYICMMCGHLGYPPSFPADTRLSEEMRRRIAVEVTSKIQPAWDKLLAVIAKEDAKNER